MRLIAVLVSLAVLALATPAAAQWEFAWSSEVTVKQLLDAGQPAERTRTVRSAGSGRSPAELAVNADGSLVLHYDTPAGRLRLDVSGASERQVVGDGPILVPALPPGAAYQSAVDPGWSPHGIGPGVFEWQGADRFTVRAGSPGSTVSPPVAFTGIGTRRNTGGDVTAPEPGAFAIVAGALAAAAGLGQHARRRRGHR
jgi:hypothetical protein